MYMGCSETHTDRRYMDKGLSGSDAPHNCLVCGVAVAWWQGRPLSTIGNDPFAGIIQLFVKHDGTSFYLYRYEDDFVAYRFNDFVAYRLMILMTILMHTGWSFVLRIPRCCCRRMLLFLFPSHLLLRASSPWRDEGLVLACGHARSRIWG